MVLLLLFYHQKQCKAHIWMMHATVLQGTMKKRSTPSKDYLAQGKKIYIVIHSGRRKQP